jgi:GTP-binding protein
MKLHSAEFVTSVGHLSQVPAEVLPEIAFAGRSNVGKSSLLNRLLNRKNLAKTSNAPGKTRTLNYYRVNRTFYLVDLPGYGYARRSQEEHRRWAGLINDYLEKRESLQGVVQLLDARHDPTALDLDMLQWLLYVQKPFLVVATKTDKLPSSRLNTRLGRTRDILLSLGKIDLLPFSARSGRGREAVWRWIQEAVYG